jgi:hypothetical protein
VSSDSRKQKQKLFANCTNLRHFHFKIADTIDSVAKTAVYGEMNMQLEQESKQKRGRRGGLTADGRPESAGTRMRPTQVVIEQHRTNVSMRVVGGSRTSSRPICVTLMPMVLRGNPRP